MAGIVGAYRREGYGPADRGLLVRQTELLASRGPDDGAVYLEGPFALGHRRFDGEGRAQQPHWDQESRVGVVIDGHLEELGMLRRRLEGRGHRMPHAESAAVLLAAYREWGDGCVEHLSGAFAFAILDREAGHFLLARDRLGVRPLYYHVNHQRFAFASEVRALLADPGVPRILEPQAVAEWFIHGFVPEPWALFRGVQAVLPGEMLLVSRDRVQSRRYWRPGDVASARETAVATLRARLEDAVFRTDSDEPWVALSGGRVSTFLAALVRRRRAGVATVTLPGIDARDRLESRRLADEFGLRHQEVPLGLNPSKAVRAALEAMDLPVGDPSFVAHAALARLVRTPERAPPPLLVGHGAHVAVRELRPTPRPAASALSPAFLRGPALRDPDPRLESVGDRIVSRLAADELRVVDRLSVLAARAVRAPLVTPDVVLSALAIRGTRPDWGALGRGLVPERIASRAAARLGPPLAQWMRGPLNRWVEGLLFTPSRAQSGFMDRRRLRWWWYRHQLGVADHAVELWRALVFEHWYQRAMTGESPLPRRRRSVAS